MFTKTITTQTRDKLKGEADEIEKHREEAAKTFANPLHYGTSISQEPDPDHGFENIYTITTTWREGPETQPEPAV